MLLGTRLAFMANVVEYGEWKTEVRIESLVYSGASMGAKIGTGLGEHLLPSYSPAVDILEVLPLKQPRHLAVSLLHSFVDMQLFCTDYSLPILSSRVGKTNASNHGRLGKQA